MKVWVDILTPKQALFFVPLAEELRKEGGEVFCTTRQYREMDLYREYSGADLSPVGRHGGGSRSGKLKASAERVGLLAEMIERRGPDVAVSFTSPECARVAFGLGVPHICVGDSPHAEHACRLAIPLSNRLLAPWIIPYSEWIRYGISRDAIVRYRALDPAAWLKRAGGDFGRSKRWLDQLKSRGRKLITVRLEEGQAAYLMGGRPAPSAKILDEMTGWEGVSLVVLCRYEEQVRWVTERYGLKVTVPEGFVEGASLLRRSDLFIGMGGTMTAESALLGVPTISAFPGNPTIVDRYLEKHGLIRILKNPNKVVADARSFLEDPEVNALIAKRARRLLDSMEDPLKVIKDVIRKQDRIGRRSDPSSKQTI